MEVLKPFDGLLENEFFLGFENEAHVGSAVIGSVPDHPLVTALYAFYISTSFVNGKTLNMTPNVMYLTYLLRANYRLKAHSRHTAAHGRRKQLRHGLRAGIFHSV